MLLPDQPFRLLALLIRERGTLVTRETLRHELWSDDTFVDFEAGLNAAIKRLRETLGDGMPACRWPIGSMCPKNGPWIARRRTRVGIPEEVAFQTKPEIALEQLSALTKTDTPKGVVLADAGYGNDSEFRRGVRRLNLSYVVGIQKSTKVWAPGTEPLPPPEYSGCGRPPKLPRRSLKHTPVSALKLAQDLPNSAYQTIAWREGTNKILSSRFATVRVCEGHRYYLCSDRPSEEWLLIEWPEGDPEPTKYWFSNLEAAISLEKLVDAAKLRWRIERDYQELKQEIGLGHFEGRGWRGFHHHATLCIAAYGFLVAERSSFSPSGPDLRPAFTVPQIPRRLEAEGILPSGRSDIVYIPSLP